MRVAQMVLNEVPLASFMEVKSIDENETDRGSGGFGSSGKWVMARILLAQIQQEAENI